MYLLFDIGGTNMRVALSEDGREVGEETASPTPHDFHEGITCFKKLTLRLTRSTRIKAAAGGVAGVLNREKSALAAAVNLPDWAGQPLKKELEKITRAPVSLENDAALAGVGEAARGAGRGKSIVAYLTISTGVGGVRVVDGKIDKNAYGFEPGHHLLDESHDLESYVSGSGLEKRFHKNPSEITDDALKEEASRYLAIGLHNTIVFWSPEIIVLGGSLIVKNWYSLDRVSAHLKKILKVFPGAPPIRRAELGDKGGLYGALSLLR